MTTRGCVSPSSVWTSVCSWGRSDSSGLGAAGGRCRAWWEGGGSGSSAWQPPTGTGNREGEAAIRSALSLQSAGSCRVTVLMIRIESAVSIFLTDILDPWRTNQEVNVTPICEDLHLVAEVRWTTDPCGTGWPVWCRRRPRWTCWRVRRRFWHLRWWWSRILWTQTTTELFRTAPAWFAVQNNPSLSESVRNIQSGYQSIVPIGSETEITYCRWTPASGWWLWAHTLWFPCPSGSGSSPTEETNNLKSQCNKLKHALNFTFPADFYCISHFYSLENCQDKRSWINKLSRKRGAGARYSVRPCLAGCTKPGYLQTHHRVTNGFTKAPTARD